jgi:hypothetical protein
MVMSHEMEDAVDQQAIQCFLQGLARARGFPQGRVQGNHHVPEHPNIGRGLPVGSHGEGEHIGRPVPAQISLVQNGDGVVAGQQDAQFSVTKAQVA